MDLSVFSTPSPLKEHVLSNISLKMRPTKLRLLSIIAT